MNKYLINGRRVPRGISTLYDMGVEPYEIEYLLHMKRKKDISRKWRYH